MVQKPDPQKRRKSFSLIKRERKTDGKTSYAKVESEAISSINKAYQNGLQDLTTCEIQVREVMKQLYLEEQRKHPSVVHNEENFKALEAFWKSEYESRDLVDPGSAKNDFNRAVEAVGTLSLYSASKEQLEKELARTLKGNQQRRVVDRLNQILSFLDRGIKLSKNKKVLEKVRYLSLPDFQKLTFDDPMIELIHEVAFYTGCRIGEVFSIVPDSIRATFVYIDSQLSRDLSLKHTKTRINRKAYIIPDGYQSVLKWAEVSDEVKEKYRNIKWSEVTRKACQKAFTQESKHLTMHDLRHSYAIHLLSKGVSLSLIAQSLGNSVVVCQSYYAGFSLSDEGIEAINKYFRK
jgi:integrase